MSTAPVEAFAGALRSALRGYQYQWIEELWRNRRVAALGARKIGKDTTYSAPPAVVCLSRQHQWNLISATQRHAHQWLRDVRRWILYLTRWFYDAHRVRLPAIYRDNSQYIELDNGSLIYSHPATLRALVGQRGSFSFNEVGQLVNAPELWEGVYGTVRGYWRDGHDAWLTIVSNSSYVGSWFHKFWTGPQSRLFTKITTTYADACRSQSWSEERIAADIAEIISEIGQAAYAQWYDCKWRSVSGQFIPGDLLARASYDELPTAADRGHVLGYDPGRHLDPAAVARARVWPTARYVEPVQTYRDTPYAAQYHEIAYLAGQHEPCWGVYVDGTGPQCAIVEGLDAHLAGDVVVTGVPFGFASKWTMFSALKRDLQTGACKIAADDLDLHMELGAIGYGRTEGGQPRLQWGRAVDSSGDSQHGDRAVAVALANWGVEQTGAMTAY